MKKKLVILFSALTLAGFAVGGSLKELSAVARVAKCVACGKELVNKKCENPDCVVNKGVKGSKK